MLLAQNMARKVIFRYLEAQNERRTTETGKRDPESRDQGP
jgi:hypothetical protein